MEDAAMVSQQRLQQLAQRQHAQAGTAHGSPSAIGSKGSTPSPSTSQPLPHWGQGQGQGTPVTSRRSLAPSSPAQLLERVDSMRDSLGQLTG